MRSRFAYLRPNSVTEAVEMQLAHGSGARFLAGATDLYLDWRDGRPIGYCVDLSHLRELDYLRRTDGVLRAGALTSLRTLELNRIQSYAADILAAIARVMCTPQTRSLATVGGNLCNASPAADLAPPLLCMDAEVSVVGRNGGRTLPLTDLFCGVKQTTLDDSEVLVEVAIPLRPRARASFRRATRTSLDIALVITAALLSVDDAGVVDAARIALGSVAPIPMRVPRAEALLVGRRLVDIDQDSIALAAATAAEQAEPINDLRTSAAYRRVTTATLLRRALADAAAGLRELETAS